MGVSRNGIATVGNVSQEHAVRCRASLWEAGTPGKSIELKQHTKNKITCSLI